MRKLRVFLQQQKINLDRNYRKTYVMGKRAYFVKKFDENTLDVQIKGVFVLAKINLDTTNYIFTKPYIISLLLKFLNCNSFIKKLQ